MPSTVHPRPARHAVGRLTGRGLALGRIAAALALPAGAAAQPGALDPQCAALTSVVDRPLQDACQKSVDIFALVASQLGPGIAGGNALLGSGAALGRPGRFSVGARANVVRARLPELAGTPVGIAGARAADFPITRTTVYLPTADAALGVFAGIDVGPAHVGAVDLLGSLTYVPTYRNPDVRVAARGRRLQFGYGARVGLLQETPRLPGLGFTYLRRDVPPTDVRGRVAIASVAPGGGGAVADDTVGAAGLRTTTHAWRLVASKTVSLVTLSAGGGQDRYDTRARLGAVLNETLPVVGRVRIAGEAFDLRQRLTRTNAFVDLSLTLPVVVLTGEVGRASGGRVARTFNRFEGRDDRARDAVTYTSVGLRLRF
ncbi:MAG TPA: hypothetical protein VEZ47_06800 [Gemmatirosa sp.]|nr:hypothetical protein [Gemmatirosa sp.]